MKHLKQILILGGSAFVLAACTGNLDYDKVAKLPSKGSMFQSYLHKEYVKLAESEFSETDLGDTAYFTGRARMAANAKAFGPQNMAERALPKNKIGELSSARAKLIRALEAGGVKRLPKAAARAQAMFDCWMQEQEENFQPGDIARCRAGFEAAMKQFEAKPRPKAIAKAPPPPPAPKPVTIPGPFSVFFAFDSAKLDSTAMEVVARVVGATRRSDASGILLAGHADRAGKNDYNFKLSQKRLAAVFDALAKAGINSGSMG